MTVSPFDSAFLQTNPAPVSTPVAALVATVANGGTASIAFAAGTVQNCVDIVNPIGASEALYVDIVTTATVGGATSIPLQPGQAYRVSGRITTAVSVIAATSGHAFIGVAY